MVFAMPHRTSALPSLSLTFKHQIYKSVVLMNNSSRDMNSIEKEVLKPPVPGSTPGTGFPEM
jgi:hypothetical protein